MKKIVSKDVLLAYLDFNLPFEIHTDASERQLGAVIAQKGKSLAFYSLGFPITVYTDRKNLMHDTALLSSERIMQWRLLIEEFGAEIKYRKGIKNVVADALSRLRTKT
eukprot:279983-Ditylum_brightwellii.AAC.1